MNNQVIEMEMRSCKNCGLTFKVMTASRQKVCSSRCEQDGVRCVNPKSQLKDIESRSEKVIVTVTEPTRPLDRKSLIEARRSAWLTNPRRIKEKGMIMNEQENVTSNDARNGFEKTKSVSMRTPGPIIKETVKDFATLSMKERNAEIHFTDSKETSTPVVLFASQSMNLLDDTAEHLHELMKGLIANKPPADVKSYDPDTVHASCNCAKQIYSLMRLKLDCIKMERKSL